MVLLLNYLHWFILLCGVALVALNVFKSPDHKQNKRFWAIAITTAVLFATAAVLPASYGYKGTVQRVEAPTWEPLDVPVEDRLRTTAKPEKQAKEDFDAMVDWRAQKAKRDAAVPTDESTTKE